MYKSSRERTRDLLLEYDTHIVPPHPRTAGLAMVFPWLNSNVEEQGWITPPIPDTTEFQTVYPWENIGLSILSDQIYLLASQSGYHGTREEFHRHFGSYIENNKWEILFESFQNFPETGANDKLYFDLNENILYYWNDKYIPVNAMLITNSVLQANT